MHPEHNSWVPAAGFTYAGLHFKTRTAGHRSLVDEEAISSVESMETTSQEGRTEEEGQTSQEGGGRGTSPGWWMALGMGGKQDNDSMYTINMFI